MHYLLVPCNNPAIWKQLVGHRAHRILHPQTLAVLFCLQTGIIILSLRSTND